MVLGPSFGNDCGSLRFYNLLTELNTPLHVAIATCAGSELSCISGFQERDMLVSDVAFQTGPATRLILEMRFVCNGTIDSWLHSTYEEATDPSEWRTTTNDSNLERIQN